MDSRVEGALKSAVPFVLGLIYTAVDAIAGQPIDTENLKVLIAGLITSFFVWLIPNYTTYDEVPEAEEVDGATV